MAYANLTPADFKARFYRGFTYIADWVSTNTYNTGDLIYYPTTNKIYQAKNNNTISIPTTITDRVVVDGDNYIIDADIVNAYTQADNNFNQALPITNLREVYLLLTAHYLVIAIDLNGLNAIGSGGLTSGTNVGDVSESFVIPEWQQNPVYSFYTRSKYGSLYLDQVQPHLAGNIGVVAGGTTP